MHIFPEVAKTVKLGKIKWSGHLTGANEISPCNKLTFSRPESIRSSGRPA